MLLNYTSTSIKTISLSIVQLAANLFHSLFSEGRKSGTKQDQESKRSKKKMNSVEAKLENVPVSLPEHDEASPIGIDASHDSGMESSSTFTNANHMSPLVEDNMQSSCQPPFIFPTNALSLSLEHNKGKDFFTCVRPKFGQG